MCYVIDDTLDGWLIPATFLIHVWYVGHMFCLGFLQMPMVAPDIQDLYKSKLRESVVYFN